MLAAGSSAERAMPGVAEAYTVRKRDCVSSRKALSELIG